MNPLLPSLIEKYRPVGMVQGRTLHLRPKDAIEFAKELAAIGVVNLGIELWYSKSYNETTFIVEDPYGPDFSYLHNDVDGPQKSAEVAVHYISQQLPKNIQYVSFVLDDDYLLPVSKT